MGHCCGVSYLENEGGGIGVEQKNTRRGKREGAGRKATALDGLPIKQHYLRVFDDEWEKPFPR